MATALVLHADSTASDRLWQALVSFCGLDVRAAADADAAQRALAGGNVRLVVVGERFAGKSGTQWAAALRPASTLILAGPGAVRAAGRGDAEAVLTPGEFLSPRLRGVVADALAAAEKRVAAAAPAAAARRRLARLSAGDRRLLDALLAETPGVRIDRQAAVLEVLGVDTAEDAAALVERAAA